MTDAFKTTDHVLPVMGGAVTERTAAGVALDARQVYGTAFSIGQGFFLTAGHVLEGAAEEEGMGLGVLRDGHWRTATVLEQEVIASLDLGVVRVSESYASIMAWETRPLILLHDFEVMGYPFALDIENRSLTSRAFKGYVVGAPTFWSLSGHPPIYELSLAAPKGLSGAPILTPTNPPRVAGVLLGNRSTEMNVLTHRERLVDGSESIIERYEQLQLGVALQSSAVLGIRSSLLSATLREFLQRQTLLFPA